jgi:peroxiredoxin
MRFAPCLALLAAVLLAAETRAEPGKLPDNVGRKIGDVVLTGLDGKTRSLASFRGSKAVVVVFLSFECPVSASYSEALNRLAQSHGPRGVAILGVLPTQEEAAALARQAREFRFAFPLFRDGTLAAARAFQAQAVPEVFVLDHQGILRYRGRIDDGYYARLKKKPTTTRQDLSLALDEVLAGKSVSVPVTEPIGCPIRYRQTVRASGKVTWYRDVLPIVQNRCQQCHRPGEVGPFALMTYRQGVHWAEDIKQYTRNHKMPPWKPTDGVEFIGARKLTQSEIDTLAAWMDEGTPQGDPKDAPKPVTFTEGWQLGNPDLILEPREEMTVGADGRDLFRCFVLPTNLPEDRFVVAYEVRPGNRRVVHHTLHFLDTRGRARKMEQREAARPKSPDEKDHGPGYNSLMGPGFIPSGDVGGWAPGITPHYLSEGVGFYLPKGADIVMQVHYHRTGRVEKDRPRLGLYFAKKPSRPLQGLAIPGLFFRIPPNVANYKVKGSVWAAQDFTVHTVTPHMHLLGRSIKVTVAPPDGKPFPLVDVKDWDYNWQETYFLKQPLKVKAGTKFTVEGVYDNTARNPSNPNSPPKAVYVGEQTTNEMCFGFIGVTTEDGRAAGVRISPGGLIIRRPGALPPRAMSRASRGKKE